MLKRIAEVITRNTVIHLWCIASGLIVFLACAAWLSGAVRVTAS